MASSGVIDLVACGPAMVRPTSGEKINSRAKKEARCWRHRSEAGWRGIDNMPGFDFPWIGRKVKGWGSQPRQILIAALLLDNNLPPRWARLQDELKAWTERLSESSSILHGTARLHFEKRDNESARLAWKAKSVSLRLGDHRCCPPLRLRPHAASIRHKTIWLSRSRACVTAH